MSEAQVVKAASLRDVVALVPFVCGFHPRRSLVLLSLRGQRLRVGQVARVDLPPLEDAAEPVAELLADLMTDLVSSLVRDGARAGVIAVYDEQPWDAAGPPHHELVTELRSRLDRVGIGVRDAVYVSAERYWSYLCRDPHCCPPAGGSVAAALASPLAAELVVAGVAPLASREELAARLEPGRPLLVAAVADLAWRRLADTGEAVPWGPAATRATWGLLDRLVVRYRAAPQDRDHAGAALTPEEAGELVAAVQDVAVRDELLLRYCRVGLPMPHALRSGPAAAAGAGPAEAAGPPLPGLGAERGPDQEHEEAMGRLLVDLCTSIAGPLAAAPLSVLAWHSWARGEGALARIAVERALAEDPTYRLALLLTAVLDHGLAPDWVGRARAEEAAS